MKSMQLKLSALILMLFITTSNVFSQEAVSKIVFQSLAWSPDGKTIAFTAIKVKQDWSDYSGDKWTLFLYNVETKKLEKLESGVLYFSFSPNGKMLAFDKKVEKGSDIYMLDLITRKTTNLINSKTKNGGPSWSKKGKSIVFYSNRSGQEELYSLKLKGSKIRQLTKRKEHKSYNPICSPNSNLVVYYLEKGDNMDQIYLTDINGSFHINLTNDEHHNIYPSWTNDGRIIYTRDKGELMIMNSDGSGKVKLIDTSVGQVKMSPDGKILLFSKSDGNLYTYKLDSGIDSILLFGNQIFE